MKAEEVKYEKEDDFDMDNEDWEESKDPKKKVAKDDSDSDSDYESSKERTKSTVRKLFPITIKNPELSKKWKDTYIPIIKQQMSGLTYTGGMFGVDASLKSLTSSQTKQIENALH